MAHFLATLKFRIHNIKAISWKMLQSTELNWSAEMGDNTLHSLSFLWVYHYERLISSIIKIKMLISADLTSWKTGERFYPLHYSCKVSNIFTLTTDITLEIVPDWVTFQLNILAPWEMSYSIRVALKWQLLTLNKLQSSQGRPKYMSQTYLTVKSVCLTLSTPALRMKLPFLFHLSANIGPLCWPKVLARLPEN